MSAQDGCNATLQALLESLLLPAIRSHEYVALAIRTLQLNGMSVNIKPTTPSFLRNGVMLDLLLSYAERRMGGTVPLVPRFLIVQLRMSGVAEVEHMDHVVAVIWPRRSTVGYIADAFCETPCKLTQESLDFCANGKCTGLVTAREITARQVCTLIVYTPA